MKYLLFIALLFEVSAHAQTEWPAGEGVCRGRWAFDRYEKGRVAAHGVESQKCGPSKERCGSKIETIYHTCRHKSHGWGPWGPTSHIDSKRQTVMWDHNHIDVNVNMNQHCRQKMEKREVEGGPNVPETIPPQHNLVDYGKSYYNRLGGHCIRRDRWKKCQAWKYESEYKCFAKWQNRDYAVKQTAACGIKEKKEVPKNCCEYTYYNKRTKHVGPAKPTMSGISRVKIDHGGIFNTSDHPENGGRVAGSEQCRTGDDLLVESYEQAQKKFSYLRQIFFEIQPHVEKDPEVATEAKVEYSAILHTFELMFQHHWDLLEKDQRQWIIDQIKRVEKQFPDLRTNPVIEIEIDLET